MREMRGIPGPFPLAFGDSRVSRAPLAINTALIKVSRGLFSYQMFFVVEQLPSLEYLLRSAQEHSTGRPMRTSVPPDASRRERVRPEAQRDRR